MLNTLRDEVIEAQKGRLELLKWKLILVAGLGGIGLGFSFNDSSQTMISPHLLLGLIPLVCLYVDALCRHLQLRILVISDFIEYFNEAESISKYEKFCHDTRRKKSLNIFWLEDLAMEFSTVIMSILIIATALLLFDQNTQHSLVLIGIGVVSLYALWKIKKEFHQKCKNLADFAKIEIGGKS